MGDVTVVTGATGFVGASVVRRLLAAGHRVRVLTRPGNDRRQLAGQSVEIADGDLQDATSLRQCLQGCRLLFHVAALYTFWARDRRTFYQVNVDGTRRILEEAARAGVSRVVYTSTVGALGIPQDGRPGTEETPVGLDNMVGDYKRSKFLAEEVARDFRARPSARATSNPRPPDRSSWTSSAARCGRTSTRG